MIGQILHRAGSVALLLCVPLALPGGADYFPSPDSAEGWRILTDAAAIRKTGGMDLGRLDQAFEFEKETSQHGDHSRWCATADISFYEKYFGKGIMQRTLTWRRSGKAFTSISCRIMLQEKRDQIPEGLRYQGIYGEVPAGSVSPKRSVEGRYQAGAIAQRDLRACTGMAAILAWSGGEDLRLRTRCARLATPLDQRHQCLASTDDGLNPAEVTPMPRARRTSHPSYFDA